MIQLTVNKNNFWIMKIFNFYFSIKVYINYINITLSHCISFLISTRTLHRHWCHTSSRTSGALFRHYCGHSCWRCTVAALHYRPVMLCNGTHGRNGNNVPTGKTFAIRYWWWDEIGQVSVRKFAIFISLCNCVFVFVLSITLLFLTMVLH